jgi:hypothetical protein
VLAPLHTVLDLGNQAMRWLAGQRAGLSISTLLSQEIQTMANQETALLEAFGTVGQQGPLG